MKKIIFLVYLLSISLIVYANDDLQNQLDWQQLQIRSLQIQQQQAPSGYSELQHLQHLENMKRIHNNTNTLFKAIYLCCDGKKNYCDFLDKLDREWGGTGHAGSDCSKTRNSKVWKKYKITGEIPVWKYSRGIFGGDWKAYFSDGTKLRL